MPKKRQSTLYSKPPSTIHRPLSSVPSTASATGKDAAPTVAELLTSMRASGITSQRPDIPVIARSMPVEIRQLLHLPETPTPRPRTVRSQGRGLPTGPAPPSSWLEPTTRCAVDERSREAEVACRTFREVDSLPGISSFPSESSLLAMCLRCLARSWETQQVYNRHHFAALPSRLRSLLLSYIAAHGPPEGVGYGGLKSILRPSDEEPEGFTGNDDFDRLDLGGSIGRSLFFKQLQELILPPQNKVEDSESWDTVPHTIPPAINAPIHALRMLSLANPLWSVSWSKLLSFVPNIPTLTHLSLANWPTPRLVPNATNKVMPPHYSAGLAWEVTGGLPGCLPFTLELDYSEQTLLLGRLSRALYSLEYLDLDGCQSWAAALSFHTPDCRGIDWVAHWGKIRHISLHSGVTLSGPFVRHGSVNINTALDDAPQKRLAKLIHVKETILVALKIEEFIRKKRGWIEVEHDEWPSLEGSEPDLEKLRCWTLGRDLDDVYENIRFKGLYERYDR